MTPTALALRGLRHYWRTNLAVVAGIAIAVSVLAGALVVGSSVKASLRELAVSRLGAVDELVASTGFVRAELPSRLGGASTVAGFIALDGLAADGTNTRRAANVAIYGIDSTFVDFQRVPFPAGGEAFEGRQALITPALARDLGVAAGDSILARLPSPSIVPSATLHGRRDALGKTMRATVRVVLPDSGLGVFSLRPNQGEVRAIYLPLSRVQREIERPDRINALVVARGDHGPDVAVALKRAMTLADAGLSLRPTPDGRASLESDSGIIGGRAAAAARRTITAGEPSTPVFAYLAHTLKIGAREIPYAVVAGVELDKLDPARPAIRDDHIWLNAWAAAGLGAKVGDTVVLGYDVWDDAGAMATRDATFTVGGILPMSGVGADPTLTPDFPGISDRTTVADWDPSFPVDLKRITPRDEDYWKQYKAAPKAFVSYTTADRLWSGRFGRMTSLRIGPAGDLGALADRLTRGLSLEDAGIVVQPVRAKAIDASEGTTDFGQYFFYFSFFLVVAALILTGLFFRVGVEQRLREIGLLEAIGLPPSGVRGLFLREGAVLVTIGSLLGVAGAIGYASLIMLGLRTWWVGAVGTTALRLQPSPLMLAAGAVAGGLTAILVLVLMLRQVGRAPVPSLLKGALEAVNAPPRPGAKAERTPAARSAVSFGRAALATLLAAGLLLAGAFGAIAEAGAFFGAGACAMAAGLFALSGWLRRRSRAPSPRPAWRGLFALGVTGARARPGRSVLAASLIAFATFVVVAVGAFRREDAGSPDDAASGTGGYTLMAEGVVPLMFDPATAEGRAQYGLDSPDLAATLAGTSFDLFRVRPGDDGSCLNLYRPDNPRIAAPSPAFVARGGRFTFAATIADASDAERANPWRLLDRRFDDGAVAAIVDATSLQYVFHGALGDDLVVPGTGGEPVRLRVVATLSHSVFQSEILIGDAAFVRLYPQQEGHRLWMIDGDPARSAAVARLLEDRLSDAGLVVTDPGERLRGYQAVENTYLSTFQALGALGLVLGTLGLGAVIVRNVLERRREMALLTAVGYRRGGLRLLVAGEVGLIVATGVVLGTVAALVAVQPALSRQGGGLPVLLIGGVGVAVALSGVVATVVATAVASRLPLVASLKGE
jgi:putative ABC transport system permease protein